jgi:hypothetical protein
LIFKDKAGKRKTYCQFIEFCLNIEEIQIDGLCSDSQLAQDLDNANVLPNWVIPIGVIFNPKDPHVTLKNVTRLQMNPYEYSDFTFGWKDIFSQNLYRIDFNINLNPEIHYDWYEDMQDYIDDKNILVAAFHRNVKTLLQETHLKHIVINDYLKMNSEYSPEGVRALLKEISENCQSVTKLELLETYEELSDVWQMTNLKQLTFSQMQWNDRDMIPLKSLENLTELQIFEISHRHRASYVTCVVSKCRFD